MHATASVLLKGQYVLAKYLNVWDKRNVPTNYWPLSPVCPKNCRTDPESLKAA